MDKLQEWIPHITTENKGHINTRPEISGFEFIWNTKFNNKYLNCVKTFTCIWNTTFKIQISNLIAFEFLLLINSQLTTKVPPPESMQVRKRLIMTVTQFQRSRGDCECFDSHKYWVDKMSFIFKRSWIYWAFSASLQIKNLLIKCGLMSMCYASKDLLIYFDMNSFPCFGVGGPTPETCPIILDTPCIRDTRLWKE